MLKDCDNLESEGEEHSSKNISLPFVALGGGYDSDFFLSMKNFSFQCLLAIPIPIPRMF